MQLYDLLEEKKTAILEQWIKQVFATYPMDPSGFIKNTTNRITNPLGYAVTDGLTKLYDRLLKGEDASDSDSEAATMDQLIKLRAVQEFTPSAAIGFIYQLKDLVAGEYSKQENPDFNEWLQFAGRIDKLALQVFDLFVANRERLFQIRIRELKSGTHTLTDGTKCISGAMRRKEEQELGSVQEC